MPKVKMILCACGCGQFRPKYDNHGRERKFINNHQNKKLSKKRQLLSEEVRTREKKRCFVCKKTKILDNFTTAKNSPDGHSYICKPCSAKYSRKIRKKYPGRYNTNKKRKNNRDRQRKNREEIRMQIVNKLGKKCVNCGNEDLRVLHIDHINNDGSKDPYRVKDYEKYYNNLLNLSDDELFTNYQILCANCNWIKRYGDRSPVLISKNVSKKVIRRLEQKCINCGKTDIRTLQIDHINSGGKAEMDTFKNASAYYNYLLHLPLLELTANYQVLCANCNWIKRKENKEYKQ